MSVTSPEDVFLSVDWGTTAFRLHLVEAGSGRSLAAVSSPDGINAIHRAWQVSGSGANRETFFLRVLGEQREKIAASSGRSLRGVPMVMSGMVTSSIGLREIPHQAMPFALDGSNLRVERYEFSSAEFGPVLLVSGARTTEDMMRGEETQIVGAHESGVGGDALFILPGTHSKQVTVEHGHAVGIRTFMTGEFFELLARHSILANSIEAESVSDQPGHDEAFVEGVKMGATENLLHASFGVRVAELSGRRNRPAGYHYLSGLVIGTELAELRDRPDKAIILVGTPTLIARYTSALHALGHTGSIRPVDAGLAVIAGHQRIARRVGVVA